MDYQVSITESVGMETLSEDTGTHWDSTQLVEFLPLGLPRIWEWVLAMGHKIMGLLDMVGQATVLALGTVQQVWEDTDPTTDTDWLDMELLLGMEQLPDTVLGRAILEPTELEECKDLPHPLLVPLVATEVD